jgi:hypothetical protein
VTRDQLEADEMATERLNLRISLSRHFRLSGPDCARASSAYLLQK